MEVNEPSQSSDESTSERVIQLLNEAGLSQRDSDKVRKLQLVQELIVHKEQNLLDNFTDEFLAFQTDRSLEVKKVVIGFMEEASKKDNELLTKVIANLNLIRADAAVGVTKKLIQSMTQLFGIVVNWLSKTKYVSDRHKACWKVACEIRDSIIELLDSDNDGVRTQSVKFTEKVILTLSEVQHNSEHTAKSASQFSLDKVPANHPLLKYDDLEADGEKALNGLLAFVSNPAISSVNLMAAMGTLSLICKQRPQFMATVVQAFEALHANLPPTLAKTQVASVRKHLKMQLMNILRLVASHPYHPQITNLLYDLGTTASEIARNMPKVGQRGGHSSRKRNQDSAKSSGADSKKLKKEIEDSDEEEDDAPGSSRVQAAPVINEQAMAIDITAKELCPLLTPQNVANLVLLSMVMLPDKMPDAFQASYTPIESAGTDEQISHLARLLSIQMTAMKVGPGVKKAADIAAEERQKREKKAESGNKDKKLRIETVIGGTTKPILTEEDVKDKKAKENIEEMILSQTVVPRQAIHRRIQGFKLESITTPLSLDVKDKIVHRAVERVLKAETNASIGGIHKHWQKILPSLVAQFGGELHRKLAEFILADVRNRTKLALGWLYEEFNIYLENSKGSNDKSALENYDACLTGLLQGFQDKPELKDDLFLRLVKQAPLLTENAVQQIAIFCKNEKRAISGLSLVKRLVGLRVPRKNQLLRILLSSCMSNTVIIQSKAIEIATEFYKNMELREIIQAFSLAHLKFLKEEKPPNAILSDEQTAQENPSWNELLMKQCLALFLALLPLNHDLILDLAEVYIQANGDAKRVVLRGLDEPVSKMGMESARLLQFVEGCPKGAETLVTRVLHILTDKVLPSVDLVNTVRDLYIKRVPDVRFLIPVLNGLEKHEVLKALPKLVQLSSPVVKGVFNRLLGVNRIREGDFRSNALTPVELLVALHDIHSNVAEVKNVIKATSFCFAQKAVYTSEVLVTVINQLVERVPIPTLFMRTVIQSVITYPRLSGFIMNVLQRLISKKVWEQEKVWEGFVKCCQRLKPQSFQVLLQLPAEQLKSIFDSTTDMRNAMKQYIDRFTSQQKAHINKDILVLLNEDAVSEGEQESARKFDTNKAKIEQAFAVEQMKSFEKQEVTDSPVKIKVELDDSSDSLPPGVSPMEGISSSGQSAPAQPVIIPKPDTSNERDRRSPTPTLDEAPEPN